MIRTFSCNSIDFSTIIENKFSNFSSDTVSTTNEKSITSSSSKILHKYPDEEICENCPFEFSDEQESPKKSTTTIDHYTVIPSSERRCKISDSSESQHISVFRKCFYSHPKYSHEHTDLTKQSAIMSCPNCLTCIQTDVRFHSTCSTHALAISLLPICLCALPYCTTSFRDAEHFCPVCGIYLGTSFATGKKFFCALRETKKIDGER